MSTMLCSRVIILLHCLVICSSFLTRIVQQRVMQLDDVCGSKYNDDPFDAQKGKADDWEETKKRIQAIVEAKAAIEKEEAEKAAALQKTKEETTFGGFKVFIPNQESFFCEVKLKGTSMDSIPMRSEVTTVVEPRMVTSPVAEAPAKQEEGPTFGPLKIFIPNQESFFCEVKLKDASFKDQASWEKLFQETAAREEALFEERVAKEEALFKERAAKEEALFKEKIAKEQALFKETLKKEEELFKESAEGALLTESLEKEAAIFKERDEKEQAIFKESFEKEAALLKETFEKEGALLKEMSQKEEALFKEKAEKALKIFIPNQESFFSEVRLKDSSLDSIPMRSEVKEDSSANIDSSALKLKPIAVAKGEKKKPEWQK